MAIQVINIGSSANKGDGDPLRTAFKKINENFAELDVANTVKDIKGSVFADDSTVLVDSVNGTLNASALSGSLPAIDGSALTGLTVSTLAYSSLTGTPTTISGYGITDAYTKTEVDNAITSSVLPSGSTQSIDVVAQDSTVLVDSVNGTLNATTLTGALPAIDGSALTGIDAYTRAEVDSAITSSVLPSGSTQSINIVADDSTVLIDSVNGTLNSSALTKPIALADDEKITFGTDDDLEIFHNGSANYIAGAGGTILTGNWLYLRKSGSAENYLVCKGDGAVEVYYDNVKTFATSAAGIQIEQGVEEKFATLTGSTGTVTHDCDNGHVFYHTGASGDITANFTNLGLTAEYGTNLTVIINQGATPYEVTAVQIGGAAQTINWQGGSAPTGNANGIDSFSFTILNDGGSYVVLGQMVDFT